MIEIDYDDVCYVDQILQNMMIEIDYDDVCYVD